MLNFKTDCYRGGQIRRHPKPRWHGCLNFKKPSCPRMNTPSHNVLAPSNAQHSKVMRNVQYLKVAAPGRGRWRKVCWKRFKLQQRTAEYQTRIITNSTNNKYNLVIRNGKFADLPDATNIDDLKIEPNCKKNLVIGNGKFADLPNETNIDDLKIEPNCKKNLVIRNGKFADLPNETNIDAIRHYSKYGRTENHLYSRSMITTQNSKKYNDCTYQIMNENSSNTFLNNKLWAHLHCYDIDKFDEIYGEYIDDVMKYFSVVVTYSKGDNIPNHKFTILKIQNKGMDVGAKMCVIKFLKDKQIVFDFIMMLQSKSNIYKRKQFFDPYLTNLNKIVSNLNQDIGICCSNLLFEGNHRFKNTHTLSWGRNEIWMNYIIDKFLLPKNNFVFPEGNNYILHREVANYMFDNRFDVYQYLNTFDSFDHSWVVNYYKLHKMSKEQVYQKYKRENLYGNNLKLGKGWNGLADCMIEHTFERIPFSVCKLLNKKVEIINYDFNEKLNKYIKFNEPFKHSPVVIIACHTSSELKLLSLMNNLKYFFEMYDLFYIVNSTEFKGDIEKHIEKDEFVKNNYIINNNLTDEQANSYKKYNPDLNNMELNKIRTHYKEFGANEGRVIPNLKKLYINYEDNSKYVCHQKWYNCLKNNIDFTIYKDITLTNDSFLITKNLPKIQSDDCEMKGIIDSFQGKYHIPDFFRIYNENGIRKWMNYYINNKNNCNSFYDMINIMEIGSQNIFRKTDTVFKVPKNYNKNIHFDKKNRESFYSKTNYPVIKLKAIEIVDYKIPTEELKRWVKLLNKNDNEALKEILKYIPNFKLKDYKNNNIDLWHMNDKELLSHFINHGITEGRKYNNEHARDIPDYFKKIIPENILEIVM
jgi:hypothetical protein